MWWFLVVGLLSDGTRPLKDDQGDVECSQWSYSQSLLVRMVDTNYKEVQMLLILFVIVQRFAFAGGDISEEDLKKHTQLCHNESQGNSCLVLAEQTLCGRGFNEETAAIMKVACSGSI